MPYARTICLLAALTLAIGWGAAHAQPRSSGTAGAPSMRMPSAAEIEAARSRLSAPGDIDAAMRAQSIPQVPDTALDPSKLGGLDLSELAARYDRIRGLGEQPGTAAGPQQRTAQGLMIFASLGMPEPSLGRLIQDAERLGAPIILRGVMRGSMQASLTRIQQLMGQRKVSWQIDPALFRQFKVQGVPAYLLIDPSRPAEVACSSQQCSEPVFAMVTGDVTAAYALQVMASRAGPLREEAERQLSRAGGAR